jgi:signal peptidase I
MPLPPIALLLSLIHPGLGHVYLGRSLRGLSAVASVYGFLVVVGLSGVLRPIPNLLLFAVLVGILSIGLTYDAVMLAKKTEPVIRRGVWLRVAIAGIALNAGSLSLVYWREQVIGYGMSSVSSEEMSPTLRAGDVVFWDPRAYRHGEQPEAGDVVVLRSHKDQARTLLRVVGVGGDSVELRNGDLLVNRILEDEPYLGDPKNQAKDYGPAKVPPGTVFVLGDDRSSAEDSRSFGPVGVRDIEGKALQILWAKDLARLGLQME